MDLAPVDPGGTPPPLSAVGEGAAGANSSGGVVFTPLYGVHSHDPLCYLLRVGRLHLLLDCGWTDLLDPALLEPLRAVAPLIDAVLLSHPDMAHAGALPYAFARLGLRAAVLCTAPVARLAQLMLYDQVLARTAESLFDLFSLDDIDAAFDGAVRLKYAQPHMVGEERDGVSVTPLAAGHLLGGTIWRISKDTEDLVYAVGFNHREERILGRTVLETAVVRPAVLLADAGTALVAPVKRKQRDAQLGEAVSSTLGEGGSVLMPVDTGGRVLELLVHLEQLWAAEGWGYPVVVCVHESYSMLEYAKGSIEWLNPSTVRLFDASRTSPFNFKYIRLCHSVEEVEETEGPKVVLASLASMEAGFCRTLFLRMASDLRNTLLFTHRAAPGTLAHTLQTQAVRFPVLSVVVSERVPLEGEELRQWEEQQRQQQQAAMDAARGEGEGAGDEGGDEQAEGEEEEEEGAGGGGVKAEEEADGEVVDAGSAEFPLALPRPPSDVFCEGFTPLPLPPLPRRGAPRSRQREGWAAGVLFPFSEGVGGGGRWDEYGEVVDAEGLAAVVDQMRGGIRPTASVLEAAGVDAAALAEAEDLLALMERPSRVEQQQVTVTVNCAVRFIDYEGLADGRSVRTMLSHVAPLKLILVHGTPEGTAALLQQARSSGCSECEAPAAGESVDLTAHLATFRVKLSDDMVRSLKFNKLPDGYEVAYVEGRLHPSSSPPRPASLSLLPRITAAPPAPSHSGSGAAGQGGEEGGEGQMGGGEGRDGGGASEGVRPLMELVPLGGEAEEGRRGAVMVGDVKLSEFRVLLQGQGLEAGFVSAAPLATAGSGVLKCGDSVALRKVPDHKLVLEGSLCDDYYRVRQLLYSQYSTL